MPMKSMAVQILAGSMTCVCHTVNTDLKVANVCGFLQCVTLSSCVKQCLICKLNKSFRWRQRLSVVLCLVMQVILLAVLCLDVILYCPLLLCMVESTSNSNTSQANEYKSTKSGRVAMRLPCCHFVFCGHFPPEETTDM